MMARDVIAINFVSFQWIELFLYHINDVLIKLHFITLSFRSECVTLADHVSLINRDLKVQIFLSRDSPEFIKKLFLVN